MIARDRFGGPGSRSFAGLRLHLHQALHRERAKEDPRRSHSKTS